MDIQNILLQAQPGIDLAKGLSDVIAANLRMTRLEDLEDRKLFQTFLNDHVDKIAFKDAETGFEVSFKELDMSSKFQQLIDGKNISDMEKPLRTLMELAAAQQKEYIRGKKIIKEEVYKKEQEKKDTNNPVEDDGTYDKLQEEEEEKNQQEVIIDKKSKNVGTRRNTLEGTNALHINGIAFGEEELMQTHLSNNNINLLAMSPESRNFDNNNNRRTKSKDLAQTFLRGQFNERQPRGNQWNLGPDVPDESDGQTNDYRQWAGSIVRKGQAQLSRNQESTQSKEEQQEVEEEVKEDLEDMSLGSSSKLRQRTSYQPIYSEQPIRKTSQKPKVKKSQYMIANSLRTLTCLMTLCYGLIGIAESYRNAYTLNEYYNDYQFQGIAGYVYIFFFAGVIALSLLSLKHPRSTIICTILVLNLPLASVFFLVSLPFVDAPKAQYAILFTFGMLLTLLILSQILSETDIIDGIVEFFNKAMR